MPEILIHIRSKFQQLFLSQTAQWSAPNATKTGMFRVWKILLPGIMGTATLTVMFLFLMILPIDLAQKSIAIKWSGTHTKTQTPLSSEDIYAYQNQAAEELQKSQKMLSAFTPVKPYLVINTTTNSFELFKGGELIREGKCSTGSYVKLQGKDQEWIFKTPKGFQTIRGKAKDPVWKKPDWAFVEEGMQVPSLNHHTRFEYGVLGNYALHMGDGYMIHGTLYQRLIGLPVTHGCIRLGDDDLEAVYKTLAPGSKVLIL
jgi:L,D-transpeptidase YbiS